MFSRTFINYIGRSIFLLVIFTLTNCATSSDIITSKESEGLREVTDGNNILSKISAHNLDISPVRLMRSEEHTSELQSH